MCPGHNGFSINVNLPFHPSSCDVVILSGVAILNQYSFLQSEALNMPYVFKQPLEVNSPTIRSICPLFYFLQVAFEPLLEYL